MGRDSDKNTAIDLKTYKMFILLILTFYAIHIFNLFPVNCLKEPVTQHDYAIHFIEMQEDSSILKAKQRIWAYNPYHSAGYISGVYLPVDNHLALLLYSIMGDLLGPVIVFNLTILLSYLILPLLVLFTAKNLKFGRISSLVALVLSILLIIKFNPTRSYMAFGMYSYVLVVFLSFYTSSLLFNYMQEKKNSTLIKLTISGSIAFFVHPLSFIICAALCVPLFIFYFRQLVFADFCKLAASSIIILIFNLMWVVPFVRFLNYINVWSVNFQTWQGLLFKVVIQEQFFRFGLLMLLFSMYLAFKKKDYKFIGSFSLSYVILFIISIFGSQIGLANLEPYRFIVPTFLLSIFVLSKYVETRFNIFLLFLLSAIVFAFIFSQVGFTCGFHDQAESQAILDFIKLNATDNSRLHVEDSLDPIYFKAHYTSFLSYSTSKEILAAVYPHIPAGTVKTTQFTDNTLFGKHLNDISYTYLKQYLDLYNVKYFLVFSDSARDFFENKMKGKFKKVLKTRNFSIYEYLLAVESFCYKCNASVDADYDRISVKNATSNTTILKYHFMPVLKIDPPFLKIKPINLLGDPVPFIMVENGNHSNFVVYND